MKEIALRAAREGGRVLLQKFGTTLRIERKSAVDLVTDADREAEETIVGVIRHTFPRHAILAEEADYGEKEGHYRWIIDPLDGTTNYAHAFPWFAVSIALEVEGEVVLGVVYNPAHQELFYAERGKGAFLNDVQIRVSSIGTLEESLVVTGFPYDRKHSDANNYDHFVNFQQAAQACRRVGSAALDLAYTAAGRFDGYWEMKLNPWDLAAGKLLVEEAGGRVTDFAGAPCDIFGDEILASNGLIHGPMQDLLARGRRPSSI
ncbi:inositol monophosphatase family protein [Geoalkalibacter halelectricus]|uniref:inositol monophosphatase family protein n=1 Tax=Geoalkalibacter halelectricus TaxID=2847045 RepID=UPI00266EAA6D|nr:inositol monophosphatase family protein [Geoalkalibacter halelectricus]MDO3376983.1 inositol monophosphatase [Geoalkalibacter halelectricus]